MKIPEVNEVIFTGRLTATPESKTVASGKNLTNMRVAINKSRKDERGQWKTDATFLKVTAWGQLATACQKLSKGDPIMVFGFLRSNSWQTKDGKNRTDLEVIAMKMVFFPNTRTARAVETTPVADGLSNADAMEAMGITPAEIAEDIAPF